ncbi:hypothetical protein P261_01347 [Lachnospiraceae bacterium TWA4]|nr:hypothetical protein P261_01347 [Lachnospiraceae bacterium TWA4]
MANSLYNKKTIIGRLKIYFQEYFSSCTTPTAESLFLLVLSILALESAHSIRFLYEHFLSGITEKSLNAFYYICSYANIDYKCWMRVTVQKAVAARPTTLCQLPIYLCVDDTVVPKFSKKFQSVSTLYDHTAHNGSLYLHGHCFVSLMIAVPVYKNHELAYLSIPVGYRL